MVTAEQLEATRMTGIDLIVLAPWLVFAVALAVIWLLLLRSRPVSGAGPGGRPGPSRAPRRTGSRPAALTHRKQDVRR